MNYAVRFGWVCDDFSRRLPSHFREGQSYGHLCSCAFCGSPHLWLYASSDFEFMKKGVTTTMSTAVLFLFSIVYFSIMNDVGLFDPW